MSNHKLAEALRKAEDVIDRYALKAGLRATTADEQEHRAVIKMAFAEVRRALAAHEQQAGEAVAEVSDFVGETIINARCLPHTGPMLTVGTKLFTHPQQPLSDEQIAVLKFLDGSGLLRGVGYGGLPDGERRPFWWRKQLGDAFPQIRAHGITKDTK